MQTATEHHHAHRRPAALDIAAAGLLLTTVVLHVVAMAPAYFGGAGEKSLMAQTDQAALYAVLAASWALALVVGLIGPHRTPVAAALAAGIAATELGFRVADLGDVFRFGAHTAGPGLWLMEAAWLVGAAGAVAAVLAARSRHRVRTPAPVPAAGEGPVGWAADGLQAPGSAADPYAEAVGAGTDAVPTDSLPADTVPADPGPTDAGPTGAAGTGDTTSVMPAPDRTDTWAPLPAPAVAASASVEEVHERRAWSALVVVLALLTAGAFLPAWDRAYAVSTQNGDTLSRNLGNAFSGPWQQVVGTVLAAVALAVVPIAALRLRDRAVGAALTIGALLVLTSQFVAAVVQVDQPLDPAQLGISSGQVTQLGLQLGLQLTSWFTVDALAAYALFAVVMAWATLRHAHANSAGTWPSAPELRRDVIAGPS